MGTRSRLRGVRRRSTRLVAGIVGTALIGSGLLVVATTPPASAEPAPLCGDDLGIDFDGNGAGADAAIGVPGKDHGSATNAGSVEVRYACHALPSVSLQLPVEHRNDRFGAAVAAGPMNNDAYTDLVVGVPGLRVNGKANAGGVAVFRGSRKGLVFDRLITQASPGVPGSVQGGARFGSALAFSRVEAGVATVLRIGEPDRNVGSAVDAGGYVDLITTSGDATHVKTREVTLATAGIPGSPQSGDQLGAALSSNVMVGAPGRKVHGHAGAGAVLVALNGVATLVTQDSAGMPGTAETGDHFGAALAGPWIGVPGEKVGSVAGAGVVQRYAPPGGDAASRVLLSENSPNIPGTAAAGDHFGAALAELGLIVDDTEFAERQLLIGVPGKNVGAVRDAGAVVAVGEYMDPDDTPFELTRLNFVLHAVQPAAGAGFGRALARDGLHGFLVGAPGRGSGHVTVFSSNRDYSVIPTVVAVWSQQAGRRETGDAYGSAAAISPI